MAWRAQPTPDRVMTDASDTLAQGSDFLGLRFEGAVAYISIERERYRNALSVEGWRSLTACVDVLSLRDDVKLVVLRGAGRTFSAGFDIREWETYDPDAVDLTFAAMETALEAVEAVPVPTVAVVEGVAAGAGCQLALACDLRLMAASASIGMPVLRLGILPSPRFALRLSSVAGPAVARELLYTGRLLRAAEADLRGLASAVVDDDDLDSALDRLAEQIAAQPRTGLLATKAATTVELCRLRETHRGLGWSFSDPSEFPTRVAQFLERSAPRPAR